NNASHTGNITYIYDATGVKLKKITTEGSSSTTEYAGNYIYKNGTLEFFNHAEGIVEHEADGYKYVYQFKDHLGNIRLSYKDADKNGAITQSEIVQEKNYYPFGLQHKGYNFDVKGRKHDYGYNGKEEQSELGLDWIDYGARNYNAAIGRWMNMDPLAEKYYDKSSYNYSLNNPVFFVDPDGRTVDVTDLVNGGTKTDTWLLINLMANLSETTGSVIKKSTSRDGVSTLTEGECKSNCKKSNKAGSYVSHLLSNDSGTITVKNNDRNTRQTADGRQFKQFGSQASPNGEIYLDAMQISNIQYSLESKNVDSRTMDTGFVFLHESLHTRFGASYFNSARDNNEKEGGRFRDPTGGFCQSRFCRSNGRKDK
ncbi:RHS repeat domain-containing protein, partial [Aquimarina spinulae]